jgi:UDP-N-acetylglucosamine enolpyruvyl transferase
MGRRILGHRTNRLTMTGVAELHGTDKTVGPDSIDAAVYLAAALVTGGE